MPTTSDRNDTSELLEQLLEKLTALEAQKDPGALKAEVAQCRTLVRQLQAKTRKQRKAGAANLAPILSALLVLGVHGFGAA